MERDLKLLDDQPLDKVWPAQADVLSFAKQAELVADYIRDTAGPAVIHVDGAWGTGKSSFCNLVAACCSKPDELNPVKVTTFVSTQYEGSQNADQAIMCAIASAILGGDQEKALERVRSLSAQAKLGVADADGHVDAFERWLRGAFKSFVTRQKARSDESAPGQAGDLQAPASSGEVFEPGPSQSGAAAAPLPGPSQSAGETPNADYPDPTFEFKKLLVIIDDLDRANSDFVARILDTVKRFVATADLYFLVAADHRVLVKAIAARTDSWRGLGITPENALEKYIRLRIGLPDFSSLPGLPLRQWLDLPEKQRSLLRPAGSLDASRDFPETIIRAMGNGITPRELKRLINQVTIRLHDMLIPDDRAKRAEQWGTVVFSEVLRMFWPEASAADGDLRLMWRLAHIADVVSAFDEGTCLSLGVKTLGEIAPPSARRFRALCQLARELKDLLSQDGVNEPANSAKAYWDGWRNFAPPVTAPAPEPPKEQNKQSNILPEDGGSSGKLEELGGEADGGSPFLKTTDGWREQVGVRADGVSAGAPPVASFVPEVALATNSRRHRVNQLDVELQRIEVEVDSRPDGPKARSLLERALKLIEENFPATSAVQVGNLAVSAENADYPEIAWRLHSLQRDAGRFDGAPNVSSQYVSFLVDCKWKRLPMADPRAGSDDPIVVAEYWLEQIEKVGVGPDLGLRMARLRAQLAILKAGGDKSPVQEALAAMLSQYSSAPTRDGAIGLLSMASHSENVPELVRQVVTAYRTAHGEDDAWLPDIMRGAGDVLATSASPEAQNEAIRFYEMLKPTPKWNADTKHNLATLLYNLRDEEDRAMLLWEEAYREKPDDLTIRRGFAQILKRRGRNKEALAVLEGKPL